LTIRNIRFVLLGDYKEIEANPETILELSKKLMDNGVSFVPGTFQQFNPNLGMKPLERIMFNSSKEKVNIQIGVEAIEITKIIDDSKLYNFKPLTDQFLSQIKKIVKALVESTETFNDGRRSSLVIDIIHDREKIKDVKEVYETFNKTIPGYNEEETFEWNTRAVKRVQKVISGYHEDLNVVTEVLRVSGRLTVLGDVKDFDTVQTRIDINTTDSNNKLRINDVFISDFLDIANEIFSSHNAELEVKIVESN
jgi:hypothetical protein